MRHGGLSKQSHVICAATRLTDRTCAGLGIISLIHNRTCLLPVWHCASVDNETAQQQTLQVALAMLPLYGVIIFPWNLRESADKPSHFLLVRHN